VPKLPRDIIGSDKVHRGRKEKKGLEVKSDER
jgi:hypothetical protein